MPLAHTVLTSLLCLFLMLPVMTDAEAAGDKGQNMGQVKPPLDKKLDKKTEERGRYLIKIAGCNDCHTTGYAEAAGKIPEQDWLKGDSIGWRGPWGTTYASNLRLYMQNLSEGQWIQVSRAVEFRPPMPWFVLREMTDEDLRAIYRFIRHLGPAGEPAPTYLPPDQEPPKPYILFPSSGEASK
jgi:mono/diheme cytochrome c family protein